MMNLSYQSYQELNEKAESIQLRRREIQKTFQDNPGISFYIFSTDLHNEEESLFSEWKAIKIEMIKRNREERRALESL